jgi:hypothetical protein
VDWKFLLLVPATIGLIAFLWWLRKQGARFRIFGELWAFMRVRKKWWLGPVIIFLVFLSFIIVFAESNALAPFIYRLF